MDQMLEGIIGATAIIDDILIAGRNMEEHDKILKQVVERATKHNLRLNFDKCFVRKAKVAYMGHVITDKGLLPDPAKIQAVVEMPAPQNKEGVRRFLGLVQYLSKFIPNLSQVDAPLRTLLKSDCVYRKGKDMKISDALSRAFLSVENNTEEGDIVQDMICMISVSKDKYSEIQDATKSELFELNEIILKGWPDLKVETPFEVREYWDSRDQLSVLDGIIYKGLKIVIPPSLRDNMLKLIHKSHLGMTKCKKRAREVMYWPRMNTEVERYIENCALCASYQNQQPAEPLKPTPTPDLPYMLSKAYILTVDYNILSTLMCLPLNSTNTTAIVEALKSIFATHGIPTTLRSDNGPQFSSSEFKKFSKELGIDHQTSSPHFQSANGEAERSIQTVKNLWRKSDDKHLSLLDYRTTPLEGIDLSPSQLLMGRRPRNTLPTSKEVLKPNMNNSMNVKRHFDREKEKAKVLL
ncbi:Hypothetical predicted protein [Mytilus galloprovincialis]|uniref:Integrase catalytic domain-containing protein n=1 Tax=Mytilus galloprovincialis TaxID=29158 RepID=A0A8B6H380_MYTGA|nr:Hypothetical predicted protein [Mytilus galloprovincialis]